jgi:hypothetical protein
MDKESIIYEILNLCKKNKLTDNEINNLNELFDNNIVDINYDDGEFILSSSFFGNADMLNILINHNANIHIFDNKPYRLAVQNNNIECIKILH